MIELEPEFSEFWRYFPKKKSKGDAYKAWIQTKQNRPALATILKALVVLRDSEDWVKENGRFVPYPATWLRSWGWADVAEIDKADVRGNEMWWKTTSGVQAKAKELGMEWDAISGETFQEFTARVKAESAAKKIAPIKTA